MLNKRRLLTPGPTMLPERVRLAMAHDMIHHRKSVFKEMLSDMQEGLSAVFGTSQPVLPLAASGSGAMVAAVTNLFAAGEKVLVVESGVFGKRWTQICEVYGVDVEIISVPWGQAVTAGDIAARLDADSSIVGVLVQLSETSTGVMHPLEEIGRVFRNRSTLLVVDGISGVSISPCPMDAWSIDCLMTGSQKGLMLPPGLALIALSERAWAKNAQVGVRDFYFNLAAERACHAKGQTNFTAPVSMLVGLNESLAMFDEVGLDTLYRKQWAATALVRIGLGALGLELLAKDHFAWGVTSVVLPAGITSSKLLAHAAETYGVFFAAGQGAMKETVVRFGHMGWVDFGDLIAGLYAFAESYTACGGYLGCRDYLEQALAAYSKAMKEEYPGRGYVK